MNFGIYIFGLILLIGAVVFALLQAGLGTAWVAAIGVGILGVGVMIAVGKTDPGEQESGHPS